MMERLPRRENVLVLQHVQQFRLQQRRHLADLVEQNRALVAELEFARLGVVRASEGARLVAEQFALQQVGGNGGAVHLEEGAMRARGKLVDQARQNFLAGPALAQQQHGDVDIRDQRGLRADLAHRRAGRDEETRRRKVLPLRRCKSVFPGRD